MFRKKGPLLLFLFLFLILVFIVGVRYGQNVERVNNVVDYVIKLTPTAKPSPIPSLEYRSYTIPVCAVSFLYPTNLAPENEASMTAVFVEGKDALLHVTCLAQNKLQEIMDTTTSTASVSFQGRPLVVKKTNDRYIFSFRNSRNGRLIYALVQEKLYPLFEGSLKF